MVMILTHLVIHFLSLLLFVIQRNLSEFWIQSTYHVCPKWKWFASFGRLNGDLLTFDEGHTCQIERICTVCIKLFDGMIRELKMWGMYLSWIRIWFQLELWNALEAQGLKGTLGEDVFKMSSGSLVVLKGIRYNNLYYLKGSAVIKNLTVSGHLEDDSTRLWQMRLRQVDLNSLKALAK